MDDRDRIRDIASRLQLGADSRVRCPFCSDLRKAIHKHDRTMSIVRHADRIVYNCWHCNEAGAIPTEHRQQPREVIVSKPLVRDDFTNMQHEHVAWVRERHLTKPTIEELGIKGHGFGVAFPYDEENVLIGYKVRNLYDKRFIIEGRVGGLFLLNRIQGDTLIITEGEVDAASFWEVGLKYAASIPHGALDPNSRAIKSGEESPKLAFLHEASEKLKQFTKIILCLDNDANGRATQAEIARRLGKVRCLEVVWPEGCKDANDVLVRLGARALQEMVSNAKPMEIPGLHDASYYRTDLLRMRDGHLSKGFSTGMASIDEIFTVSPGCWTCVTGHPGSGKSEWVDQTHVNLVEREGWNVAYCSPENPGYVHVSKLIEKRMRKRFHLHMKNRMTEQELEEGYEWVNKHFQFLSDENAITIESVLERLTAAVMRRGAKAVCIDPFNYISLPGKKRDDIEISDMLSTVGLWCKSHETHAFFVAHPKKTPFDTIPKGFDIAGAAAWWAKADFGVTIHRPDQGTFVEAHVWKVRHAHLGACGSREIGYNRETASYFDLDEVGIRPKLEHRRSSEDYHRNRDPYWYDDPDEERNVG